MQRAAIIGYGVTGASVLRHLRAQDVEVLVFDTRSARTPEPTDVEVHWGCEYWPHPQVDLAVVSPGLSMQHPLVQGVRDSGVPLCSDIDLFFDAVRAPVIGVTGTNGKSTVTTMVGAMLTQAGRQCGVGGNLGTPALDLLDAAHTAYVLELSSFQLERSRLHPFHAATVLNVSEDHLDHHGDMTGYAAAKQRIYAQARHCIFNREDVLTVPPAGARAVSFGLDEPPTAVDWGLHTQATGQAAELFKGPQLLCNERQLPFVGRHNLMNALAACALADTLIDSVHSRDGLLSYTGLPHRFQVVGDLDGVVFVNDSKATNAGATLAALNGLPRQQQVMLVAGGDAKGADLSILAPAFAGRVRTLFSIGRDGPALAKIAAGLDIAHQRCASLEEAVACAHAMSRAGDIVLLSPACASLDMFANYQQRGERFAVAVAALGDKTVTEGIARESMH